jgi:hypothetical protein
MSWLSDALDYAGGSLDKPGRAVRGLLGGRPDEFANLLPFSDSLGVTDPANQVSGRDLVTNAFGSTGSDLGDSILGFGAEMALDPTTYFGGAIGRLGGRALGRGLESAAAARGPGYGTTALDVLRSPQAIGAATPLPSPDRIERVMGLLPYPTPLRNKSLFAMTPEEVATLKGIGEANTAARDAHAKRMIDMGLNRDSERLLGEIGDYAPQALSELPPGSRILGNGAHGIAFQTPAGDVVRMGSTPAGELGRPVTDAVLQPTRTADYPMRGDPGNAIRVERMPKVAGVGDAAADYWRQGAYPLGEYSPRGVADYMTGAMPEYMQKTRLDWLTDQARAQGLNFWDNHLGNVGIHEGRPVIVDPGAYQVVAPGAKLTDAAVTPLASGEAASVARQVAEAGQDVMFNGAYNPVVAPARPGFLSRALLDALGGRPAMRRALDRGLAAPTYQRDLGRGGLLAGALLGSTSGG